MQGFCLFLIIKNCFQSVKKLFIDHKKLFPIIKTVSDQKKLPPGMYVFLNICPIYVLYGTGSYPPLEKGLHRSILQAAIAPPFTAPYFSTASSPYWEQVGI